MIYSHIEHFRGAFCACEPLRRVLTYIVEKSGSVDDGTYELGGDGVKVQLKSHKPLPFAERRYESHIKYVDVQVVVMGEEVEHVQTLSPDMKVVEDRLEKSDVRFHADPAKAGVAVTLRPGMFAMFMPEDAHKTEVFAGAEQVRKAIGKIPVGLVKF